MKYRFRKLDQALAFMRWLGMSSIDFNFRCGHGMRYCVEIADETVTHKNEIEDIGREAALHGAYS